jgi:hypothetical protein
MSRALVIWLIAIAVLAAPAAGAMRIDAIVDQTEYVEEKNLDVDLMAALAREGKTLAGYEIDNFGLSLRSHAEQAGNANDLMRALMALPMLIPDSTRLRRLSLADAFIVVSVISYMEDEGVKYIEMEVAVWDMRGTASRRDLGVVDLREKADKPDFLAHAARELLYALGTGLPAVFPELAKLTSVEDVICNPDSRIYHTPSCHHLPKKQLPMRRDQADAAQYRPCLICFPPRGGSLPNAGLEKTISQKLAGEIEYLYRVKRDATLEEWVNSVGGRITTRCGLTKRRYLFILLDSEDYNAFAAGAGYIYVTTGTLDAVESDDELAAVLAQQIAHTELQHPVTQYKRGRTVAQIGKVISWITGRDLGDLTDFTKKLISRGYSREFEFDADRMGVIYARRAGFDPDATYTAMGKVKDLEEGGSSRIGDFMRSHPRADDRIAALKDAEKQDEEARQYFQSLRDKDPGLCTVLKDDDLAPTQLETIRAFVAASEQLATR